MLLCLIKRHGLLFPVALFSILISSSSIADSNLTFGGWNVECEDKNKCIANQLVTSGGNKEQTILGVMVGYDSESLSAHIIIRFNAQADKSKGAAVKVDQFKALRVSIDNCDNQVCQVRSLIPEGLLEQMKKGKFLRFAFYYNGKQVTYPIVLAGFDKAYDVIIDNKK